MPVISRLPIEVAERIAAGEVVDRPYSIVKELIENSLDAQARHIEVFLIDGGRELIGVNDDGCGMSAADAELSVERHATSKLKVWEDLEHLDSFGFRGEALPSIAAVSRFELVTSIRDHLEGTRLVMEGPLSKHCEVTAGGEGTRISVRDLFWNTPARRKFLKSAVAESAQIADLVARFAVLHPRVGFKLVLNEKEKLLLVPGETAAQRLSQLWNLDEGELLALEGSLGGITVEGVIARPAHHRRNRSAQVLAVNSRLIRSQTLSQAITEGFDPLVPRNRHPYAFVHLRVDGSLVDVNIHPTKAEVRFADTRSPFRAIYHAIQEGLRLANVETLALGAWESALVEKSQNTQKPSTTAFAHTDLKTPFALRSAQFESFESKEKEPEQLDWTSLPQTREQSFSYPREHSFDDRSQSFKGSDRVMELFAPPQKPVSMREVLPNQTGECPRKLQSIKFLTWLYRAFLVMEVDGELWVIDQHAAHERIQYERLHRFQALGPQSQGLVIPISISLSPSEYVFMEANQARFHEIGFEFNLKGQDQVSISAVPPGIKGARVEGFFRDLVADLVSEGLTEKTPVAVYQEKLRAMIACKSSIRARESISEAESLILVRDLIRAERSPYCPHGRPTRIRLDSTALERLFQRT